MQEELRSLLTTVISAERIAWGRFTQDTPLPAVLLHLIGNADGMTMQGPDGLWRGRVQVDCYALTYGEAAVLARAVITLLRGYRGGGFRGIILTGQRDDNETVANDRPCCISMDFKTNWRESDG